MRRFHHETLDLQLDMLRFWGSADCYIAAATLLDAMAGAPENGQEHPLDFISQVREKAVEYTQRSPRFFLSDDILPLVVMAASKVEDGMGIPHNLTEKCGILFFQTPIPIPRALVPDAPDDRLRELHAVAWFPGPTIHDIATMVLSAYDNQSDHWALAPATFELWEVGAPARTTSNKSFYRSTTKNERGTSDNPEYVPWLNSLMVAFWIFIESKVLIEEKVSSPRPALKRSERAPKPVKETDVRLVHLRKALRNYTSPTDDTPSTPIDWQHRWMVGFHYRTYVKGREAPLTIPIFPYAKGPEDKPWMPPRKTVFVVDR